jgi:hypothetical protein
MWTTAADLVRFGASWSSLLPEALAREALRPQTAWPAGGGHFGLGWHIGAAGDIIGVGGGGPGTFVSLLIRDPGRPRSGNLTHVAMTNRRLPIQPVNIRALRACCPALPEERAFLRPNLRLCGRMKSPLTCRYGVKVSFECIH